MKFSVKGFPGNRYDFESFLDGPEISLFGVHDWLPMATAAWDWLILAAVGDDWILAGSKKDEEIKGTGRCTLICLAE